MPLALIEEPFNIVRHQTNLLLSNLTPEDCQAQPIEDVSPAKWHLGHTSWFFEVFLLKPHLKGYREFDSHFNFIFNSYYNNAGSRQPRAKRGDLTRPSLQEVLDYRAYVDKHMLLLLDNKEGDREIEAILELGLNHEQQHQELFLTDIKYVLGHNPLKPAYHNTFNIGESLIQPDWLEMEEGIYECGRSGDGFCFDNEGERHKVFLPEFSIQNKLVTNAEYLEFIESGAYKDFNLWLSDAWYLIAQNNIEAPLYWEKIEGVWHYYTLSGFRKINPHEPVTHISYYEADAFASWKGLRLPTEFEWEATAYQYGRLNDRSNMLENNIFHPAPAENNNQLFGDCWEWTSSAYLPYPKFKKAPGAIGEYNGKFMINQMVLRGGSCATPFSHIRHSYRNFFQPDKRWQFTGIRLAKYA